MAKHPPREIEEPAATVTKHLRERIKATLAAKHPQGKRPTHARQQSICQRGGTAMTTAKYLQDEPTATAPKHSPERISATLAAKHLQGGAHTLNSKVCARAGVQNSNSGKVSAKRDAHTDMAAKYLQADSGPRTMTAKHPRETKRQWLSQALK